MNDEKMIVEWKDIVGIRGVPDYKYMISNSGEVMRKKTGTILSKHITNRGYFIVSFGNTSATIHRLVAIFFVPGKSEERNDVNHIDGCKLNNWYTNLEWVSHKENIEHGYANGLIKVPSGEESWRATIPESSVDTICRFLLEYNGDMKSVLRACDEAGIRATYQMVQQIKHKQSWVSISDKWFDSERFKIRHFSTEDVEKICESLVKHNGNVPDVLRELQDVVPYTTLARINSIKMKLSHVSISDKYFKSFIK